MHVQPPDGGLWRVGRAPDPLAIPTPLPPADLDQPDTGNRFDSALGNYSVLYFGSSVETCFGETLARFRPDTALLSVIKEEWEARSFMASGNVPADWRYRRLAVQVEVDSDLVFLDVEDLAAREMLKEELAEVLVYMGHKDLDIATIRGADRRVTRYISQWAYEQADEASMAVYAGVRYLSRLSDDWECWAVFHDVRLREMARNTISAQDPALMRVAKGFGLVVH